MSQSTPYWTFVPPWFKPALITTNPTSLQREAIYFKQLATDAIAQMESDVISEYDGTDLLADNIS